MESQSGAQPWLKRKMDGIVRSRSADRLKVMQENLDEARAQVGQIATIGRLALKHALPALPPRALQVRVVGVCSPDFFDSGIIIFQQMEELLKLHGRTILDMESILDFGCGCGRVMIPMMYLHGNPATISGTDIDEEAVRWFKWHYPCFRDLDANGLMPPTKYTDASFDFIYSISIFTHLPEDMQHAWLSELCRILRPGGHAIFTTHGENHFQNLSENALAELTEKGFYYSYGAPTDGLPEFYQTSYHTHDYIRREWDRYFEVIDIRAKWISNWQDAVLLRKRA